MECLNSEDALRLRLRFAVPAALFLTPVTVVPAHSSPLTAHRIQIDSAGLVRLVDSAMAAGMAAEGISGAAFILVQGGRVVLAKGYGQADVAAGRAWDPERTIFPIASITKLFTATAVMQLADRGLIDLNADVNRYLRSVRVAANYSQPVTAAQLLSHTAGFDELPGRRVRSASELVPLKRFLATRLVRIRPPGLMTSYSSFGMALAGLLVEDVSAGHTRTTSGSTS